MIRTAHYRAAIVLALTAAMFGMLVLATPASAQFETATCRNDNAGTRHCVAASTTYPETVGWYGFVGMPAGPCNASPIPNLYPAGVVGGCMQPPPEVTWRYLGGNDWEQVRVRNGARVYVHPYQGQPTFRWIWSEGTGWTAIPANRLLLAWRA